MGDLLAGILFWYLTSYSGQLSLLPHQDPTNSAIALKEACEKNYDKKRQIPSDQISEQKSNC